MAATPPPRRPLDLSEMDDGNEESSPASRASRAAPVWDDEPEPPQLTPPPALPGFLRELHSEDGLSEAGMIVRAKRQLREELEAMRLENSEMAQRLHQAEAAERAAQAEAQQMRELAQTLKTAVAGLQSDLQQKFEERSKALETSIAMLQDDLSSRTREASIPVRTLKRLPSLDSLRSVRDIRHVSSTNPAPQVSQLKHELSTAQQELSAIRRGRSSDTHLSGALQDELARVRQELSSTLDELRTTKSSLTSAWQQLADVTAKAERAQVQRDDALQAKKDAESEEAEARFQAAEARSAQSAAEAAHASAELKLATAREEIAECQAQLAEREAALAAAEGALAEFSSSSLAANIDKFGLAASGKSMVSSYGGSQPMTSPTSDTLGHERRQSAPELGKARNYSLSSTDGSVTHSETRKSRPSESSEDSKPIVEMIADMAIEGAKVDSVLTNPTMGMSALLDFVNEWRGAIGEISQSLLSTTEPAPPSPSPSPATTIPSVAKATLATPEFDCD
eukprot:scaffold265286_cov26-Tisochrysis_lutea.AAC.1